MTIDIRAALERLVELNDIFGGLDWRPWPAAIAAARLALAAEPEPEGPTGQDIEALHPAVFSSRLQGPPPNTSFEVDFVRAALTHWGQAPNA